MNEVQPNDVQLNEVVEQIAATSATLNSAAATASERIEKLDEQLLDAEIGVSVWGETLLSERTVYGSDNGANEPALLTVTLGFSKTKKKKWGLCVREQLTGKKGVLLDQDITLLRKADRRLRLLAMPHLPALAAQILEQLQASAEQLSTWQPSEPVAAPKPPEPAAESAAAPAN